MEPDTYRDLLVQSIERSKWNSEHGSFFGSGNRRMYEGCLFAYEIALEWFDEWFNSLNEDDPAKLRAQIVQMRKAVKELEVTARSAKSDAGYVLAMIEGFGECAAGKGGGDG